MSPIRASRNDVATSNSPPLLAAVLTLALAGAIASATGSRAADWVEHKYDPPGGSHWIIQSNATTEDNMDGHVIKSATTTSSAFNVDQKTADGFRITYVVQKSSYEGDSRTAAIIVPITKALENLVIHATIGPGGVPLRIENLDEIRAAGRTAIDNMTAALSDKPAEAAAMRQVATRLLIPDESQATTGYLGSLTALALGQNTGLHPGETKHMDNTIPNPLTGAPIKADTTLSIDSADPVTGKVRYIHTRSFDPDALKDFLGKFAQQMLHGNADAARIEDMMKQLTMTLDSRTEIDVEDGMTRAMHEEDAAVVGVPGHNITKHAHKMVTVTPAP
jgi:hypothetical protein